MTLPDDAFVPFDPAAHTIADVNGYLDTLPDTPEGLTERGRVAALELAGRNREGLAHLEVPDNVAAGPDGACLINPTDR